MFSGPKIFFSYSSKDRQRVDAMRQLFESLRMDVFMDHMGLKPGDSWPDVLATELHRRTRVYVFWSANAAASKWVTKEIATAEASGRHQVFPVLLDSTPLSPALMNVQGVTLLSQELSEEDKVLHASGLDLSADERDPMMQKFEARYGELDGRQKRLLKTAGTRSALGLLVLSMLNGVAYAAAAAPAALTGTTLVAGVIAGSATTAVVAPAILAPPAEPAPITASADENAEEEEEAAEEAEATPAKKAAKKAAAPAAKAPQGPTLPQGSVALNEDRFNDLTSFFAENCPSWKVGPTAPAKLDGILACIESEVVTGRDDARADDDDSRGAAGDEHFEGAYVGTVERMTDICGWSSGGEPSPDELGDALEQCMEKQQQAAAAAPASSGQLAVPEGVLDGPCSQWLGNAQYADDPGGAIVVCVQSHAAMVSAQGREIAERDEVIGELEQALDEERAK